MAKTSKKKAVKNLFCVHCDKYIIGSLYKFNCHLFYKHKSVAPRHTCKYCSKQYYRSDTYYKHVKTHNIKENTREVPKYICDYCKSKFVIKRNLAIHISSCHLKTKPKEICPICSINYRDRRDLLYHVKREHYEQIKIKEKPLFFEKPINETWIEPVINSNDCVQVKKLNNNVITIKKCNRIFRDNIAKLLDDEISNDLNESVAVDKLQHTLSICDYCNKKMLKKSLRLHIKEVHLKFKKYKCKTCNRCFTRQYLYQKHLKNSIKCEKLR